MILVYQDPEGVWHLIRQISRSGFASIGVRGYCEQEQTVSNIHQIPKKFITEICERCRVIFRELGEEV